MNPLSYQLLSLVYNATKDTPEAKGTEKWQMNCAKRGGNFHPLYLHTRELVSSSALTVGDPR